MNLKQTLSGLLIATALISASPIFVCPATAGSIEGHVRNEQSEPLALIEVTFFPLTGAPAVATTDANGHYQITGLPAGMYQVRFVPQVPGSVYAAEWYGDLPDGNSVQTVAPRLNLADRDTITNVDMTLARQARIGGTVTDASGAPACAFANILYWSRFYGYQIRAVQTGSLGSWSTLVGPGRYTITYYTCPGSLPMLAQEFYDDRVLPSRLKKIRVRSGEEIFGLDAELAYGSSLVGTVKNDAGQPIANALLQLRAGSVNEGLRSAFTTSSGSYRFDGLASGSYKLQVETRGFLVNVGYFGEYYKHRGTHETADEIVIPAYDSSTSPPATPQEVILNIEVERVPKCNGRVPDVALTAGDDHFELLADLGPLVIATGRGNDNVRGGPGSETICGGKGDDFLRGGGGPDQLFGEGGNDEIHGNAGDDQLRGNAGNDVLWDVEETNSLRGGAGVDGCLGNVGDSLASCEYDDFVPRISTAERARP